MKSLIKISVMQSLFPLATSATLHLLGTLLSYLSAFENDYTSLFSNGENWMKQLARVILQVYSSFLQFISIMFLITIITMIKTSPKHPFQSKFLKREFIKRILIFSLLYSLYQVLNITSIPSISLPNHPLETPHLLSTVRILAEETSHSHNPEEKEELSFSVGQELNALTVGATTLIVSHDNKFLYATNFEQSYLRIIDISDIKSPTIISLMSLDTFLMPKFGAFYLTKDGRTLFATDNQYLQIINVTNPHSPSWIGRCEDPKALQNLRTRLSPQLYKPIIEISQDQKTLFVGGLGLQVFNISDLSNPNIISSTFTLETPLSTSLALSMDTTHLFFAQKNIQIFDVSSDPTSPSFIKNFTTDEPATSMILTNDRTTAYIVCQGDKDQVTIEKINISNPVSPSRIQQYKTSLDSLNSPVLIAISPCNRYIFLSIAVYPRMTTELKTFDTVDGKILSPLNTMIKTADSLVFLPNTSYLISSSSLLQNTRFFELLPNFTKPKVFSLSELDMKKYFIKDFPNSLQFSSDRQTMFFSTGHYYSRRNGTFEIFDAHLMTRIAFYASDQPIYKSFIIADNTKAVLQLNSRMEILNISNLSSPTLIEPALDLAEYGYISSSTVLRDFSTAIIAFLKEGIAGTVLYVRFFNISDPLHITEFSWFSLKSSASMSQMVLSKNQKTLFLFLGHLIIYDLSNIKNPQPLADLTKQDEAHAWKVHSCLLSPDEKILAVRTFSDVSKFQFFNVSNPADPAFVSEIILPEEQAETDALENSAFSLDQKILYVSQYGSLLAIDISDIKTPKILGIVPNPAFKKGNPATFLSMEPGGKTANVLTLAGYLYQMDLHLPEILYMKQESFKLGVKYTNTLTILERNPAFEYELLPKEDYRLIKNHFLSFEVVKRQNPVKITKSSSYDWATLDKENNAITIEPKSRTDIKSHIFCSRFSRKFPVSAINELNPKLPNTTDSKDLIATLISMGYLDNQLFITANFDTFDKFYLPKTYRGLEPDIYQMVNHYNREVCTHLEITSSLELEIADDKFSIKTPSTSYIKLIIELQPKGRFLSKSYGLIQLGGRKNTSIITVEDSLKEINLFLQELVVDLQTSAESCNGTIIIDDHLNYPLTKQFANISKYFIQNQKPVMNQNLLLQNQIETFSISTGQFFTISLNPKTFVDNHTDQLTYSIVVNNKERSKIPTWLTFTYPDLKGTPPEDLFNRNFEFIFIVKNEFKQLEIPFTLHSQISLLFAFKLAVKKSPYILTMVGLIFYASKIYNLLFRKRYRHKIEYYLKIGEEITSNVIFPIFFVAEEIQEKKLIWKYFLKTMADKLNSPNKYQIVEYFLDEITEDLDKTKVSAIIQETVTGMPDSEKSKLHLYLTEDEPRKARIFQLIINNIIEWQLNLAREQATKKIFNQLKDRCYEFVRCNDVEFTINRSALQKTIKMEFSPDHEIADMEGSLLEEVSNKYNIDLLGNALISLVFKNQSVNNFETDVNITVFRRKPKTFIHRLFKKDLLEIGFQSRGKLDYGFDYKIANSVLHFFGTPNKNFKRQTTVIQIAHRYQLIHKEIWIYGAQKQQDEKSLLISKEFSNEIL